MSDATTLIYHPSSKMRDFSKRIQDVCEENHVTSIDSAVVDGSLVLTLHTNVITATEEDVDDEKAENDGKSSFKVGEFIPDGEALMAKCMVIKAQDPVSAAKTEATLSDAIYRVADGLIEEHRIVTGKALVLAVHPEDLEKPEGAQRKVYVEKEVAYAVVVFLAEALEPNPDDEQSIEKGLRKTRPRSAAAILEEST